MERLRSLTPAALVAALLAGPGCVHVHTDADGKVKSVEVKAGTGGPDKAAPPPADPGVQPAAATVPAAAVPAAASGLSKIGTKVASLTAGPQPTEVAIIWQNRVVQLPDPTKAGAMGSGLVGQMFLIGPRTTFCQADGRLTVELYDETPRAGAPRSERLGSWTFPKDVLKALVTSDERFGKCYAVFLPWPTYTPAVGRVKLTAKFEPDHGFPLYSQPTTMTLDTTTAGDGVQVVRSTTLTPPGPPGPGPVMMPSNPPAAAPGFGPPIPLYPATPGGVPAGLPPIAITVPPR